MSEVSPPPVPPSSEPPPLPASLKPVAGASNASPSNLKLISGSKTEPTPPPVKPAAEAAPAKKTPQKKSAIDTLVARDQTAVFWFLVACIVGGGCAWYLVIMAEALKARPPFVVMDTAGAYYVAPGLNFDSMTPMHVDMTRTAVETLFERNPRDLINADRVPKLFGKNGTIALREIVTKEENYFRAQQVEQSVEIEGDPVVLLTAPTAVRTSAEGIVTRRGVFNGQNQIEIYRFKVHFIWMMNPDMRGNRAFPAVVERIPIYNLEKISDS